MRRRRYTHDPAPIDDQSTANEDLAYTLRKTPNPRIERVLDSLASGESKNLTRALKSVGFNGSSSTIRRRFEPGGDLRAELAKRLTAKGVGPDIAIDKLLTLMDAKKHLTVAGEALTTEDNDAQLRATDALIKLQVNAGLMPDKPMATEFSGNRHITIEFIEYPET